MKVVINRCYGGFSLSPRAVKRLAELNGKECYFFRLDYRTNVYTPETLEGLESNSRDLFWTAFSIPNPNDTLWSEKAWGEMTTEERVAQNAAYSEVDLPMRPENRADPLLIRVVEELGEKANGGCAALSVVEIPDGIEWEIDEYDGVETIHETHRSWS